MSFTLANFAPAAAHLRVGTGADGVPGAPRIHTYRTNDAHADVDTAGYFNDVRQHLNIGDLVYVVVVNGSGVVQTAGFHVVMTRTATAVDVSAVTVLTVTNSD